MAGGRFAGTHALVTGGSSGIGLACAARLAAEGATVTVAARDEGRLHQARAWLAGQAPGRQVRAVVCDVTDDEAVAAAVGVAADGGALRVVVASAGTGWIAPLVEVPVDAWRRVHDTNVLGTFQTLRHAVPVMAAAGGGAVTAISSVNGALPSRFHTAYSSAKAAVDMLVRGAADELAAAGIRVNSVLPGLVPTHLSRVLVDDEELRASFLAETPLARTGTAAEVAAAVCFLSSPDAAWITGVNLPVDGGTHLRRAPRLDAWVAHEHPDAPAWWGLQT